ncbi:restriction endonuclease subunit S [Lactococcus petauri]|uniref:restriction endonuclease subunit S n=1 Tax=Lactococcus petauri TaxID=1940789 RepID=UPI001FAFC141|nr:restriction endonuclease subunit S [Lactococcus petauri]
MMSKKSPQLRFEGFTDDWEERKLGKVFKTYSGMTPLRSDISNFKKPEVPWIKTTDLKNSDITSNDEKISAKAANKLKVLPVNTVLIAMYGGFNQIGRTGLLTYPATINQALTALEPNDSISPYFLLTELNYRVNDWKKFAASSRKDPNITKRDIDNFMINFPTQQEQQKVGSFFQQLDNTITLHQRKLDLLKEQKKGYLQKMFPKNGAKVPELRFAGFTDDWEDRNLKDILREFSTKSKIENEYRVLSSTNVGMEFRDGRVSGTSNLGYKIIKNGDLVLSPQNLWLGNININNIGTGLVSPSYKTFNFTDIDSSFIKPQLRTPKMLEEYKNSSTQGASVVRRNLEIDSFYQIKIATPSIKEQEKIGSFFKHLDSTISLHQRKLDLLKEQKKGFLQKMFV